MGIDIQLLDETQPEFEVWLKEALFLAYATDLVPEQLQVPRDEAYPELRELVQGCTMLVLSRDGCVAIGCFALDQKSHHIQGAGVVVQSLISTDPALTRRILRAIKRIAKAAPTEHKWIFISKRTGRLSYRGQYHTLR